MNLDGGSDQALSFNENKPPAPGLRLSRSPHPYHRHRDAPLEIQQREGDDSTGQTLCEVGKNARSGDVYNSGIYMNSEAPKRWKDSVSPSDSGTEADDENDHLLRVLPAPPLKARKGFKDGRGSAFSSPSLTPTYLDDNGQRLALESRGKCRGNVESSILADEESTLIRNKFTRRRRAELLRRLSEVFLLGAVGFISCGNLPRSFLCEHKRGAIQFRQMMYHAK